MLRLRLWAFILPLCSLIQILLLICHRSGNICSTAWRVLLCSFSPCLSNSTNTPKRAVFAGSMQLLAGIKLCTGRVLTNHPHYEDKDLRERTQQVLKAALYCQTCTGVQTLPEGLPHNTVNRKYVVHEVSTINVSHIECWISLEREVTTVLWGLLKDDF